MDQTIFTAFDQWIKQRSRIDRADYGDSFQAFSQEQRSISAHRARARKALALARAYEFSPEAMADALRAFSGRLSWVDDPQAHVFDLDHHAAGAHLCQRCHVPLMLDLGNQVLNKPDCQHLGHLEYCTGQYFPTEFALAAAVVLERYIDTVRPKQSPRADAKFKTISQIKAAHHDKGGHWFDKETLRFFRSRILPYVYSGPGGIFFVSSEDGGFGSGRRFTVRQFDPKTADVETFGPFNEMNKERAQRLARIASHYLDAAREAIAAGGWASKEVSA